MDGVDLLTWPARAMATFQGHDAADLPPESPLAMPEQALRGVAACLRRPSTCPRGMWARRAGLAAATLAVTAAAAWETCSALKADGLGPLDLALLPVSALLFAWTAFWFFTAVVGLVLQFGGDRGGLDIAADGPLPQVSGRTAILAPVFNEETHLVFSKLQAMIESVHATGQGDRFDLFVLSDSTGRSAAANEQAAFRKLRRWAPAGARVFYRRRPLNTGRKAGNIADWVRRFGAAYEGMVVLDADSLMTGDTLVRLAAALQARPDVGLIQTVPLIVNRNSLFGRTVQFAGRLYGPLMSRGVAWWSGAEGNYWGHNAIVRVRAFAAHAGLPRLPGRKPFGGEIMSHDFVEAALLRRAGYGVHMAPQLGGSFEECPPTLFDFIRRDRRWCQGNLQHLAVLRASGLHPLSRMHLLSGALAYMASPLWLVLLGLSVALLLGASGGAHLGTGLGFGLGGTGGDLAGIAWILLASMTFLLGPKVLGYVAAMADPVRRRGLGGGRRALVGLVLETAISALMAPVMMLSQTRAVVEILLARDAGWGAQGRSEEGLSLAEAVRHHGWHTAVGIVVTTSALAVSPQALLWLAPALLGLLGAIPLAMAIARPDLGEAARRAGLMLTPEETRPEDIVTRANRLATHYQFAGREGVRLVVPHWSPLDLFVYGPQLPTAREAG